MVVPELDSGLIDKKKRVHLREMHPLGLSISDWSRSNSKAV